MNNDIIKKELLKLIDEREFTEDNIKTNSKKFLMEKFAKSYIIFRIMDEMDFNKNVELLIQDIIKESKEYLSIGYKINSKSINLYQKILETAKEILMYYYELTDSPPDS